MTTTSLIILYLTFVIVYPLIALAFKKKATDLGRFWGVWFVSSLICLAVTIFLIYCPNLINDFSTWITSIF